ncbi:MAG: penicillin-binding transpeptidase domain-containing protein, partial [Pseudomonadota bacterium]
GLSVTPLQLAHAYLTLATFGEKMPLSILHGTPRRRERVFDHRVVAEVVGMMEQVTTVEGTASQAAVPGYRVAGKTGTARIFASGSYDDERHVAWFAGMVPASDPRVVMVVTVNEPSAGLSGGGVVAAPIFGRVAQKTLLMLGVVPDQQIAGVSRLEAGGAI